MTQESDPYTLKKCKAFYRNNETVEDVARGYEKWAEDGAYDTDYKALNHRGHVMVVDLLAEFYPTNRDQVYILDVAAGTGRVGLELKTRGFSRIDALDQCQAMLNEAKKKNVYQNFIITRVSGEPLDIPAGTYDAISCTGAIVEGHLPAEAVIELLRLVKPGGVIAMSGNKVYWDTIPEYHVKMAGIIEKLEQEKQLKTVKREFRDGYIGKECKAITFVLQKLA